MKSPKGLSGKICHREVPRESLITRGTSRAQILQTIPEDFSLFVRLCASKTKEDAAQCYPMGSSGETVGSDLLKSDSVKSRLWFEEQSLCRSYALSPYKFQQINNPIQEAGSNSQGIRLNHFKIITAGKLAVLRELFLPRPF